MDNDALRRGRPTVWKAFDEWTAILAGDGLLTLAFEVLSRPDVHPAADVRVTIIRELAVAAGRAGFVSALIPVVTASPRSSAMSESTTIAPSAA